MTGYPGLFQVISTYIRINSLIAGYYRVLPGMRKFFCWGRTFGHSRVRFLIKDEDDWQPFRHFPPLIRLDRVGIAPGGVRPWS